MFRAKSCPRCVGDLFLQTRDGSREWVCLHCGHRAPNVVVSWLGTLASRSDLTARRFDTAADGDLAGVLRRERAGTGLAAQPLTLASEPAGIIHSGLGSYAPQLAAALGIVALFGWSSDAAHLLPDAHRLATAVTLGLGGFSLLLLAALSLPPFMALAQGQRRRQRSQPSHVHIARPGRKYFSPYTKARP